jgi:hypothetical protein
MEQHGADQMPLFQMDQHTGIMCSVRQFALRPHYARRLPRNDDELEGGSKAPPDGSRGVGQGQVMAQLEGLGPDFAQLVYCELLEEKGAAINTADWDRRVAVSDSPAHCLPI